MWNTHRERVSESQLRGDFMAHGVELPDESPKFPPDRVGRDFLCEPVEGFLMYLGYFCTADHDGVVCGHTVRKEGSFRNHFGMEHKNLNTHWSLNCERRYVQHLNHPKQKYFCVKYKPSLPPMVDGRSCASEDLPEPGPQAGLWSRLRDEISKLDVFSLTDGGQNIALHSSVVSNYLEISGIKVHIDCCASSMGCSPSGLFNHVNFPEETSSWVTIVDEWLENRMESLKVAHYGLRKEGLKESTDKEAPTVGLSPLQEKQTRTRYAKTIARLLVFTLNASDTPLASYWSGKQKSLIKTMKELSRLKLAGSTSSNAHIYDLLDQSMFNFVSFSCSLAKRSRVQSSLEQFLALSMINEDGSFFSPLELTHSIAAVQYGIRLGTIFHWVHLVETTEELEDDDDPTNDKEIAMMRFHFSWISQDSRASPFMTLRDWIRLASTVIMNEQLPDQTHWADSEMTRLVVGSSTITICGIQQSLRAVITKLRSAFQCLLKGSSLPDFLPSKLSDDSGNIRMNFNYLVASENQQLSRFKILEDWCVGGNTQGVLAANWCEVVEHSNFEQSKLWSPRAAWKWLEASDDILEWIYFMYHVGCGQPARGTEESCMLLRNTDSAPRNVYWRSGRLMLQTWYHKGQNLTHRSKPRQVYLTGELSMQLHNYLAYIRPVQMAILCGLGQKETAMDMQDFLWVTSRRGRLETNDFTRILKKGFTLGGNDGLGIRGWRQASVSIVAAHLSNRFPSALLPNDETAAQDLEEDMGLNNAMDLQRNHSSATANLLYGYSSGTGVIRDGETNFMKASEVWQKFWGIESHLACQQPLLPVPEALSPAEKARQALTIFTKNPDARFRSEFQHNWVTELFRKDLKDLLVVAKTGGGKSLAFKLPSLVLLHERTVLVQPINALVDQTMKDLKKLDGVKAQLYTPNTKVDPSAQIIVALSDHASKFDFENQLQTNRPTRIIIDEAHSLLEDTYRHYLPGVVALGQLTSQVVLMTGSLPPSQEVDLLHGIFGRTRLVCKREVTFRPELTIEVRRTSSSITELADVAKQLIQSHLSRREDRAMVFIEDRKMVTNVGAQLGAIHHSGLTEDERKSGAEDWITRDRGVMVATSGFGAGIDYSHVRLVIIYGVPNESEANMVYQQIGRAGRDGKSARIEIIPGPSDVLNLAHGIQPGMDDFKRSLVNPSNCPAMVFSRLEDEVERSCRNYPDFPQCSVCTTFAKNLGEYVPYDLTTSVVQIPMTLTPITTRSMDYKKDSGLVQETTSSPNNTTVESSPISTQRCHKSSPAFVPPLTRNAFGKRIRSPELDEQSMQTMLESDIRKVARLGEEGRIQSLGSDLVSSSGGASVNLINSNGLVKNVALETHQAVILKDFISRLKGNCPACYFRSQTFVRHSKPSACKNLVHRCLRCKACAYWFSYLTLVTLMCMLMLMISFSSNRAQQSRYQQLSL
ncbi:hypothetical protein PGT21_000100 [Puccinia graminis f. sp. tritici]|uniref:DNA 3'-5' helicase n=1 Tax=Puccinia graminis f. sp. tritici TaxID=56615 RepID=A0A5B0M1D0_PUCGR|nr:hypothetical protein PGT21_000100 [Puccinia graminis f. sp. tritici]